MRCPVCGAEFPNPTAQAGGRARAHSKGFGSPEVLAKALATRKRKALAKRSPNGKAQFSSGAR